MHLHSSTLPSTILLCILWLSATVHAYIPAVATNDTQNAIKNGLNVTDVSTLSLSWFESGGRNSYSVNVAYELVGLMSNGISWGAFVHFSERNLSNGITITPWIALVSCDANSTDASQIDDIFTLARDRGAVAGLLYSNYSSACIINREYADPANFDQVFDIFATQSLTTARLIEERFGHINQALYGNFDAQLLNQSFPALNATTDDSGASAGPGYIVATLRAYNTTGSTVQPSNTSTNRSGGVFSNPRGEMTGVAMVVLCVIAGWVSAVFSGL